MTKLPIMPLYIERLLSDTTRLSNEEFGAYVRLLCGMWLEGGPLPDEDMRALAMAPADRWPRLWKRLQRFFYRDGDRWGQKRLIDQLEQTRKHAAANWARTEKARQAAARKNNRFARPTAPVTRPVKDTVTKSVTAPVTEHGVAPENSVTAPVTASNPNDEVLLPINREGSTSSRNMADPVAVENSHGQGGKDDAASTAPVGGGSGGDQEALPKPLGAVVGQPGSGSLFGRLAAERRRREGEGEAPLPEQGEG